MSGGKETPRQKMIGMMYLVLTALLALNVSKEILNAFVIVNNGLVQTDKNFTNNNGILYDAIKSQFDAVPDRAKGAYDNSAKLKKWAQEAHAFVADIKTELIVAEDEVVEAVAVKRLDSLSAVENKDKYDNATRIMCGDAGNGTSGRALELKNKLIEYKKNLVSILPEKSKNTNLGLNTDDPKSSGAEKETWETEKFYHLPVAAQITLLTQIQTEIRNAEGAVLNELFKSIGATAFKVDALEAQMVPSANVVAIGDEFTAKIFVAAVNKSDVPIVSVNGRSITETDDKGFIVYKNRPTSEGPQKVKATVQFKDPEGKTVTSEKEFEYVAIKPNAVVSPTKMNVFYIGVDNPVSVSVPGADPNKVSATLIGAQGTMNKESNGNYIVKVTGGTKCSIPVTVSGEGGKSSAMGSTDFRIKRIPDPTPMVLGKKSGEVVSLAQLKAAGFISCALENFDFQASFSVLSYEFGANVGGVYRSANVTGARFNADVIAILGSLKPNSKVFFSDIKARGPDGSVRTLTAQYKIQ